MSATTAGGMPGTLRAWVLGIAGVAAVGVVTLGASVDADTLLRPLPLSLAAAIAVAEVYSVWDTGRPRNCTITVSELFVAVALVTLAPDAALVVGVGGTLLTMPLRATVGPLRRIPPRSPLVLVHSVALPALRVVSAVLVMTLLDGSLTTLLAALVAVATMTTVDLAATMVVVRLDTGLPLRQALGANLPVEYAAPLAIGATGALLGVALDGRPIAWLLVAVLTGLTVAVSHAGMTWSRERLRSRVLLDVARSTARAAGERDVTSALLDQVADGLLARRVELVPRAPDWAEVSAPVGTHGWLAVAERSIPTQADFDHRDRELLEELATMAVVMLDNGALLERLADGERLRSTLLAAAAHDLRNPLAITEGTLEMLQRPDELPQGARADLLGAAMRATKRASRLVHDLIVLEQQHLAAPVGDDGADVADVVADVVAALPPGLGDRCVVRAGDVPRAAMSPVLLERVLDNLVGNALKHTPAHLNVDVHVRSSAEWVVVAVEDRGPGIPPQERERILAPFERAVTTASGYGLGLHIATEFVARAGGRLDISDRTDGPGASFRVRLPRVGTADRSD